MAVVMNLHTGEAPIYVGCVIDLVEHNYSQDSDFCAVCWDEETGSVKEVEYDTTRAAAYGAAKIDATPETLRKVFAYYMNVAAEHFDNYQNEAQAKEFGVGDKVKVVRGRKVKKGTVGEVFWRGDVYNNYSYRYESRAGIEVDGERYFVPAEYLEALDWEDKLILGEERERIIRNKAIYRMPRHYQHLFLKKVS